MTPKLCECGCGQPTKLAPRTRRIRGWVKGQPQRFVNGHGQRGARSHWWRGGIIEEPHADPKKAAIR